MFIVSNWHVLSGRNPLTGQPLNKEHGGCPDRVELALNLRGADGAPQPIVVTIPVVGDGENLWLQHPKYGQNVDVAALLLPPDLQEQALLALNDLPETSDMGVYVGQDVFILGYPLDPGLSGGLPIWKRGSIATEPNHMLPSLPRLLVDAATREGMSGSPVIARTMGQYMTIHRQWTMWGKIGIRRIGVYSGRYGADLQDQAQLGIVWRMELVDEICGGKTVGSYEIKSPK